MALKRLKHLWVVAGLAVLVAAASIVPAQASAAQFELGVPEFSGSADYQLHYGIDAKGITGDSLKLRLALDGDITGSFSYHIDAGFNMSSKPELDAEFKLGEAYVDASIGPVDLRLGNLVVNWGTADGINPTNVVNPRNMLSVTDLALGGTPVPAVEASYYFNNGSAVTGVLVLDFVPSAIPGELALVEPEGKPDKFTDKLELAIRGETMLAGYNVYASYFYGWQDLPAAWLGATGLPDPYPPFAPHLKYRRMHQFGLATAGTLGDAAVWFEGAVTVPAKLDELEAAPPAVLRLSDNAPSFQAVAGIDYTFDIGNGLFASAQVVYDSANTLLSPYSQPGAERKAGVYSLLVTRYSFTDDHQLELIGLFDITDKAGLAIPRYAYRPLPGVELWVGLIAGFGDEATPMGAAVKAANGITAGAKASF